MRESIIPVDIAIFKRMLAPAYRARIPVLAIGHKGIGKSEAVKQFCAEQGLRYMDIRLAYLEAQDIVGFPYRNEKTGKMSFSPPDWLPTEGRGILFLDEINRARLDVLQAVFQLVRDREIGGININGSSYKLPEGWSIVSAMNPDTPDERYYVSPMDESLYDRFLKIAVRASREVFKNYAWAHSAFTPIVKSFIKEEDIILSEDELPPVVVDATPRGFEMFNTIWLSLEAGEEDLLSPIGAGLIGPGNTDKFLIYKEGFYKEVNDLMEAIIRAWDTDSTVRDRIEQYKQKRNDIIVALRDRFVASYLHSTEKYSLLRAEKGLENFVRFIFSLPDELVVAHLMGIKEGYGEKCQGKYLEDIVTIIEGDRELHLRHEQITKSNPALGLADYI